MKNMGTKAKAVISKAIANAIGDMVAVIKAFMAMFAYSVAVGEEDMELTPFAMLVIVITIAMGTAAFISILKRRLDDEDFDSEIIDCSLSMR